MDTKDRQHTFLTTQYSLGAVQCPSLLNDWLNRIPAWMKWNAEQWAIGHKGNQPWLLIRRAQRLLQDSYYSGDVHIFRRNILWFTFLWRSRYEHTYWKGFQCSFSICTFHPYLMKSESFTLQTHRLTLCSRHAEAQSWCWDDRCQFHKHDNRPNLRNIHWRWCSKSTHSHLYCYVTEFLWSDSFWSIPNLCFLRHHNQWCFNNNTPPPRACKTTGMDLAVSPLQNTISSGCD
jgi:hypothetical protein